MKNVDIEHMKQFYQKELENVTDPIDFIYISMSILDKGLPGGKVWVQEILTKAIAMSDSSETLLLMIDIMFKYNCLGNKVWCKDNYLTALKTIYSWQDYFNEKNGVVRQKKGINELSELFRRMVRGIDDPYKLIILSSMIADKKYLGDSIWAKSLLKKSWEKRLSDEDFILSVQSSYAPKHFDVEILPEEIVKEYLTNLKANKKNIDGKKIYQQYYNKHRKIYDKLADS